MTTKLCACGCGRTTGGTYAPGHNQRVRHNARKRPLEERFWEKVKGGDVTECWLWTASVGSTGYGQIYTDGRPRKSHRIAYEMLIGPIPDDLVIDHLCYEPLCQNPWHMEPVTHAENSRRVRANQHKGKTHCVRGHKFTPENVSLLPNGSRRCRECTRIRNRASRERQRQRAEHAAVQATHAALDHDDQLDGERSRTRDNLTAAIELEQRRARRTA